MTRALETDDLVSALETFGERYQAVDVFADDLSEAARYDVGHGTYRSGAHTYRFEVFADQGVVRLTRSADDGAMVAGAALGTALGAAIAAAAGQRGEGVLGGAILGLLVGGVLGTTSRPPVRKVFAMELDPMTREWTAYDGSLLRWMKDRLLPPADAVG